MTIPRLAIDPFDEAFLADPYAHHDTLRDAGPVVWLEAIGCYAMARHDGVSAALRDAATFVSGRGVGLSDFAREAPWRPPSLFLAAANRDPRKWPDAERFDITRAASGHVGFGFGIHQCLGQMVARLEAEAVLGALIPRVRSIRLAGVPERRLNNTLHALATLPVEIEPV